MNATIGRLPPIAFLTAVEFVQDAGKDTYSIVAMQPLPNGGIAGVDFCEAVLVTYHQVSRDGTLAAQALRLRSGIDLARDYPNTSRTIRARDQAFVFGESEYLVLDTGKRAVRRWVESSFKQWAVANGARLSFELGDCIFVPTGR